MKKKMLFTLLPLFLLIISCVPEKQIYDKPEVVDYEPDSEEVVSAFGENAPKENLETYLRFIQILDGEYVDASEYSYDFLGLDNYLKDSKVTHFTGREIGVARTAQAALACGLENLIPAKGNWMKAVSILLIFEDVRRFIDAPIYVTSWYRPTCYNRLIGGATNSDHISADAIDVVYRSKVDFKIAQKYLCEMYWSPRDGDLLYAWNPLNMAIGLGETAMHISLFSNKGRRFWYYPTYVEDDSGGGCW